MISFFLYILYQNSYQKKPKEKEVKHEIRIPSRTLTSIIKKTHKESFYKTHRTKTADN